MQQDYHWSLERMYVVLAGCMLGLSHFTVHFSELLCCLDVYTCFSALLGDVDAAKQRMSAPIPIQALSLPSFPKRLQCTRFRMFIIFMNISFPPTITFMFTMYNYAISRLSFFNYDFSFIKCFRSVGVLCDHILDWQFGNGTDFLKSIQLACGDSKWWRSLTG